MRQLNTMFLVILVISWIPRDIQGQTDGDVRIRDGDTQYQGRVEIYHNGEWRRVCEEGWGINDAKVVCGQLGFEDAHAGHVNHNPRGTGAFWLSDVNCAGTEDALNNCTSGGWGNINSACGINDYDDAWVICKAPGDGDLRLVNTSNAYEGSLEIQYGGRWGRVCGYGWDLTSANVACKQLGFTGAHTPISNMSTRGSGRYWIQNLNCQGSEASLSDCYHDGVGEINPQYCDETSLHDAGVLCKGPNDGDVRLVGPSQYMGRVEIFYAGNWGRVCTNGWSLSDAVVTCRQLGFSGIVGSLTSWTPRGTSRVLLDQFNCAGTENRLDACSHGWIGYPSTAYCSATSNVDASVLCKAPDDGQLRLVDGNGYNSGRVEIKFAGVWRRVCHNGWGSDDAEVVCRQLGYGGYIRAARDWSPKGNGSFWLSNVRCLGSETAITNCANGGIGSHSTDNCDLYDYDDAGVYCQGYSRFYPSASTASPTGASGPRCASCSNTLACREPQNTLQLHTSFITCDGGSVCHTTAKAYSFYSPFYSSYITAYSYSRGCIGKSLCTSQELQGNTCTGSGNGKACKHCCSTNYCNSGVLDTSQASVNNNNNNRGNDHRSAWFNVICVLLLFVFARN
ncbi:scavenger receptor cysteine-rich type 1 protein M130 [Lingula anatina]|uniref:Scavenger receptor cysteine-rich type 1 protein M130 n=1 Tax=Lingula anatina TaxID=7574 RepID=A0A1S3I925_LINAN|nr:scavenger receptor cysteine-rich type 1 protein M130 [Lingula anatina]|eukprot:XP_013393889.1 scavenger receptor cysteine-rich type 1 protein M130 [Lingula anatina]